MYIGKYNSMYIGKYNICMYIVHGQIIIVT